MTKVTMYGASWCQPCKLVKPQFEKVASGYLLDMGVEFEYLDVDKIPVQTLRDFGISSVPTIILDLDGDLRVLESRTENKLALEIEYEITSGTS